MKDYFQQPSVSKACFHPASFLTFTLCAIEANRNSQIVNRKLK